jgi:hypothetical protein
MMMSGWRVQRSLAWSLADMTLLVRAPIVASATHEKGRAALVPRDVGGTHSAQAE